MYQDPAPHLPGTVILDTPTTLLDFQQQIDKLEFLGIEVEVATADILDHFRTKDEGVYNLAVSGYEMCNEHDSTELYDDVKAYVDARHRYGESLYGQLVRHGLYVNGLLYYQLRRLSQAMLVLEKLQIPLTDNELRRRHITRQADTASRRVLSAFDARIKGIRCC